MGMIGHYFRTSSENMKKLKEDEEEFFDYVYGYFAEMREFFFEAAAKSLDVAFYID